MSLKIGTQNWPKSSSEKVEEPLIVIRKYDEEKHKVEVEKLERLCEVGQRGKPSLVTDLLGDPICRIRHFQLHVMLVNYISVFFLFCIILIFFSCFEKINQEDKIIIN
jgi:hypothetical protein